MKDIRITNIVVASFAHTRGCSSSALASFALDRGSHSLASSAFASFGSTAPFSFAAAFAFASAFFLAAFFESLNLIVLYLVVCPRILEGESLGT